MTIPSPARQRERAALPEKIIGGKRYATIARAAKVCAYSEAHVSHLGSYGLIGRRKVGRYWYVCLDDLEAHIRKVTR